MYSGCVFNSTCSCGLSAAFAAVTLCGDAVVVSACSELVPLFAGESSVVLPGFQQSAVEVPV